MNDHPLKLGPLALLLAVITICMTTLAVLVFTTARADLALSKRYASTISTRYELETEAQELRDRFLNGDAGVASENGASVTEDGKLRLNLRKEDGTTLTALIGADGTIEEWSVMKEWQEDTGLGEIWDGN